MATEFAAVILAGGTAVRMDGVDKAGLEYAGRTLLEHALAAVAGATEVVVVGDPVPTSRPVTFAREDPAHGGPAAGLLTGLDALLGRPGLLAVLAVDMPGVSADTFQRLTSAAAGHDGAFLADDTGRRQLAGVLVMAALAGVRPDDASGLSLKRLLDPLDLVSVAGRPGEARDIDTWSDLRDLADEAGRLSERVAAEPNSGKSGPVNLHDWIDELCDVLEIEEAEVDEGLILDLARTSAHQVERVAAPVTTYLLGLAAGTRGANPVEVEGLAARAQALAEGWDRPADAPDPDDVDEPIPDDSGVDHSTDKYVG